MVFRKKNGNFAIERMDIGITKKNSILLICYNNVSPTGATVGLNYSRACFGHSYEVLFAIDLAFIERINYSIIVFY